MEVHPAHDLLEAGEEILDEICETWFNTNMHGLDMSNSDCCLLAFVIGKNYWDIVDENFHSELDLLPNPYEKETGYNKLYADVRLGFMPCNDSPALTKYWLDRIKTRKEEWERSKNT